MCKSADEFIDHFARLGVMQRINSLAGHPPRKTSDSSGGNETDKDESAESSAKGSSLQTLALPDARDFSLGKPYHWRNWNLVRGRDCVYLWNEHCALELSCGSNGWFRFLVDGKMATMYSSGSPETGSESVDAAKEFVEKLHRARSLSLLSSASFGLQSQPVLSGVDSGFKIVVGNWSFHSVKEGELEIRNSTGYHVRSLMCSRAFFFSFCI